MSKNNRFFNTLMARARSRRSPAGHKWYDAAPTYDPKTAPSSESPDANKLAVGGGSAGGLNYATGQMDLASPTSYGAGRGTMVDYYSGKEYSGGPYNYRDAPVDFKTGEQLGSPFASVDFVKDETGAIRTMTGAELASMEAGTPSNLSFVSSGEAALSAPIGAVGTANPVALDLIDMLAGGTGFATGFLGPTVVGARGKETAIGSGLPGFFGKEKVKKDYEVFENIKAGNPGYHQFYMGNQLVSIAPNEGFLKENLGLGNEFVAYGNIDIETAKQIIGGAKGIDPRTIDFSKSMEDEAFGERLVGYIPDVGGLTQNLEFVDSSGKINSSVPNPTVYAGLMATAYGNDRAAADLNLLAQRTGSSKMAELAQQAARGELSARPYRDDNGQVIGFESPTGGYVTSKKTGEPVKTGSGGYVVYGTGPVSAEAVLGDRIGDMSGDSGSPIGDFSVSVPGYTTVSGGEGNGGSDSGDRGGRTSDAADVDSGRGGMGPASSGPSSDSYFADGGRVGKQEGGEAVAKSGFIEQRTDQVSEAETVADNVPMDVEEGAFIVNGAAIEFMGIADFQKMVQDAVEKARELGIDIPENGGKMGDGEVPLAVSRGEGYISEPLAKIIGYDKLNKINNRGKKEVAQRLQESEQQEAPAPKPPILAKSGGFISKLT